MRGWRLVPVAVAALGAAVAVTVVAVAVNAATSGSAGWYRVVERHPLWWTAGATAAAAVTALVMWRVQAWYEHRSSELVPAVQRPERWVVDRPAEVNQIVAALRDGGTVGVTTAMHGAGGFGKTTVAKMVRADPRVLRRFGRRVYWVTLGRDASKQALVGLVNGLIAQIQPDRPVTFTDALQAGEHLAALVADGPRRLLVLDDVWTEEQLAVFPVAGRCALLMTTRNPSLAAAARVAVKVDQMSEAQARAVLKAGLPPLSDAIMRGLLEQTGRWPQPLRLINKILTEESRLHAEINPVAWDLLQRIRRAGTLYLDQLTGTADQRLDVTDPDQRSRAIRATIEASTGLLPTASRARLEELGVFAEDATVPLELVGRLWRAASSLDQRASDTLCARLADLALLTLIRTDDGGAIVLHDVIREYLREELGPARLAQANRALIATAAADLPSAAAIDASRGQGTVTAWWQLPEQAPYMRDHLIEHMLAAEHQHDAEAVACDLRWVGSRLEQTGPAAPFADLGLAGTDRTERLGRLFGQAAHLLAPTDPPHSRIDILYSRISHAPDWGAQAQVLAAGRKLPALLHHWPLPDLPDPAQRRTMSGHTDCVTGVAVAPDGTWLATASRDGTARIWDPATGREHHRLTSRKREMGAVAIRPGNNWLAAASYDGELRIWDPVTRDLKAVMRVDSELYNCQWSPSGNSLAAVGSAGIYLFAFNS